MGYVLYIHRDGRVGKTSASRLLAMVSSLGEKAFCGLPRYHETVPGLDTGSPVSTVYEVESGVRMGWLMHGLNGPHADVADVGVKFAALSASSWVCPTLNWSTPPLTAVRVIDEVHGLSRYPLLFEGFRPGSDDSVAVLSHPLWPQTVGWPSSYWYCVKVALPSLPNPLPYSVY